MRRLRRRTLLCALLLAATSPGCRAPLTFVRTAPFDVAWNQTLPGTDDPEEDALELVLCAVAMGSNHE